MVLIRGLLAAHFEHARCICLSKSTAEQPDKDIYGTLSTYLATIM